MNYDDHGTASGVLLLSSLYVFVALITGFCITQCSHHMDNDRHIKCAEIHTVQECVELLK